MPSSQDYNVNKFNTTLMKFSKSQRRIGQIDQFNPPCNLYKLSAQKKNDLIPNKQYGFGLVQRFGKQNKQIPGPGTYSPSLTTKTNIQKHFGHKKALFGIVGASPSIPYRCVDSRPQNQQQQSPQFTSKPSTTLSSNSLHKKQPVYTFSKSTRRNYSFEPKQLPQVKPPHSIACTLIMQKTSRKTTTQLNDVIRQASQRRKEITKQIAPDYIPSLELIELMTRRKHKDNPGPGQYLVYQPEDMDSSFKGTSFTCEQRFPAERVDNVGPGSYDPMLAVSKRNVAVTSSKRQLFDLKDQTDLEHRFYIDPNHDLLHEKKHSKTKVPFGSNCDRFSSNTANENVPQLDNTLATSERLVKMIEKRLKKQIKQLYKKPHKVHEDSGLLGISMMANAID